MFLFVLGLNFKAVKLMFLEPVYVMRESNLYHNTYAKTSRPNRLLVQVNIPLTWVNLVASVLEAVMGQSGSHPGLIVALAGSLHGIIGPGWPDPSTRQSNAGRSLRKDQSNECFQSGN